MFRTAWTERYEWSGWFQKMHFCVDLWSLQAQRLHPWPMSYFQCCVNRFLIFCIVSIPCVRSSISVLPSYSLHPSWLDDFNDCWLFSLALSLWHPSHILKSNDDRQLPLFRLQCRIITAQIIHFPDTFPTLNDIDSFPNRTLNSRISTISYITRWQIHCWRMLEELIICIL